MMMIIESGMTNVQELDIFVNVQSTGKFNELFTCYLYRQSTSIYFPTYR